MAAGLPPSCSVLFLVTEKLQSSAVRMRGDVTRNFCIANEGDSEQGASRQNLKSIKICFNLSHCGKIALYLDRIH